MQDDQSWPYRFPHRAQYPEDHCNYNRDLFRRFISPEYNDWSVVVVEVLDDAREWRIVAFSVWDISYVNKRVHGPGYIPNSLECASTTTSQQDTREAGHIRRDTNPNLAAFQAALKESNQKYFSQFGSDQIKL
ncbi:hypothetical protein NW754_003312 [Fusarium falciforme]|uniref:Uncharacterized protein n=1 Tax=Fusarium falciforme TaxID=195108 RepID=A0A9W8R3G9_9HYPO|nr:hypothetical protein NW754_003312 [Fusarium falciforme]KAJ4183876.1 hypothetical protein NW755_009416 [Fusarium falciforme]KAJ4200200.1 hypothetical protein NW767_007720 [Fusarium falciforme]KAJ4248275.1 hypothetical protein NW757_008432 [Fusarium falciforme]